MPDPWEYPWFAAWDLAFHAIPWAHLDPAFAKYQLTVLLREWFLHPNGALPAYEWNFDDVNPPVHALAAIRVFVIDGGTDTDFLERIFQKLLLNFTWWVNRQDPDGNNLFGGGFLGLDNISPVDRSNLPPDLRIEQADGTAWMAYYSLAMLVLARTLAERNHVYDDMVVKFLEHFVLIGDCPRVVGADGSRRRLLLRPPHRRARQRHADPGPVARGRAARAAGRLVVARGVGDGPEPAQAFRPPPREGPARGRPRVAGRRRGTPRGACSSRWSRPDQLAGVVATLFDEEAFLSPYGLRSVSKRHEATYFVPGLPGGGIDYQPAESRTAMYGGNSNWRGPVWLPTNYLVIRALLQYDQFFGDDFLVEYPTGSGTKLSLGEVAGDLADRLVSIWLPDAEGRRPVHGGHDVLDLDPAWRDNLQFFEYFHGDLGSGLGASHQTGWTALVADLILDPPGPNRAEGVGGTHPKGVRTGHRRWPSVEAWADGSEPARPRLRWRWPRCSSRAEGTARAGRPWIRPGPRPRRRPGPPTCRARRGHRSGPTHRLRRSLRPETFGTDSPTEEESAPEPSDTPTEDESPPEPSDTPVVSETPTPTLTSAPTEAETSEAPLPSTEATSPGTTDEPAEGDADEDSEGVPAWVWWLLAALALALAVGIPLLVRSRRSKAWSADLAGAEQEVVWLVRELLPSLQRTGSREQAVGGWAVASERVLALDDRLTSLEATAPNDSGRERARTLRDAVRVARGRMDSLATSATDQSASAEVGSIANDVSSTVWPPEPEPPRS